MVYLLLVLGLFLLAFGGDTMVSGAVALAKRLGVSALLIGLTLVGFGTSTPELLTSLIAVVQKSDGIAVGNVVGSNIANILLVLGMAAVITPIRIDLTAFKRDGFFLVLSSLALIISVLWGKITFLMGFILVGLLFYYVYYSYKSDKKQQIQEKELEKNILTEKKLSIWLALIKAIGGIALTMLGAKLLVDNSIILAKSWGVSEAVIGLTIVAVGTSLPELATSVMAAIRRQNDVAFGNVVGSNIYNALFILGFTALFMTVRVPMNMTKDIVLMSIVTVVLIGIAFWKKQISRPIGCLFLTAYAFYTAYLFLSGSSL